MSRFFQLMFEKVSCGALLACLAICGAAAGAEVPPLRFQTGAVFGEPRRLDGPMSAQATAVEVEGTRLYVGGRGFLSVYDLFANPLEPKLLGTTTDLATVRQMAVQDGMVYLVTRANGLWVVDCRTGVPRTVGHMPSNSNCTGVDVAGNVCFISGSRSGIDFIDVSDPTRPQLIANRKVEPVESQSVIYRDGYLYSGEWGGRCVTVWDCRDLKNISRVALVKLPSNGDGVWKQGPWLYACTGWGRGDKNPEAKPRVGQMGLSIFDVADPSSPKRMGRVDFEYCRPGGVDMWIPRAGGNLVFCAQNVSGLYAVDVTDKAHPVVRDRFAWTVDLKEAQDRLAAEGRPSRCVASVAVGNGVVYVAGPGGLGAWALSAKGAKWEPILRGKPPLNHTLRPPRLTASDEFHQWLPKDPARTVLVTGAAVKDDVCYAACGAAGLTLLGLSVTGLTELGTLPPTECTDVAVAGTRLFAATGRDGYICYDVTTPTKPRELFRLPLKGARDVYAFGDGTKWITCNATVYDISDPANPKELVTLVHQARWAKYVCPDLLGGRWAIGNTALKFFGWADLAATHVEEQPIAGYKSRGGGVCALGDKALLVDVGRWSLLEPGATATPRTTPFPKGAFASGIPRSCGTRVAISAGRQVGVWDFSDATAPKPLRTYALPDLVEPVAFWKGHLVIPCASAGVLMPK